VTYVFLRLVFLPHLVCLLAFLPLERLGRRVAARREPAPLSAGA
jgi:hypothetical protein